MDLRNGKRLLLLVSATGLNHWLVSYLVWILQLLKPWQPREPWHTEPGARGAVVTSLGIKLLRDVLPETLVAEGSSPSSHPKWFSADHHSPDTFSHGRGVQTKAMSQVLLNVCACDQISQLTPSSCIWQILNRKRYLEQDIVQHHQPAQF